MKVLEGECEVGGRQDGEVAVDFPPFGFWVTVLDSRNWVKNLYFYFSGEKLESEQVRQGVWLLAVYRADI